MSDAWHFGPFTLDIDNAYLWRDRQRIDLRPKTFAVLAYLVRHAGELVTKAELLEAVWPEIAVGDGVLKISLVELRKVLGETAKHPQFIETLHRRGYRFIASVTQRVSDVAPSIEPAQPSLASPTATPVWPGSHPPTRRLVGREAELEQLRQLYRQAAQGARQVVFVTGEAGIGKTALVDALVSELDAKTAVWIGRGQCLELYGAGEAYLPLFDALGPLCRLPESTQLVTCLQRHAPSWVLQMPALLSYIRHEMLQKRQHGATPERMLRELTEALESATAERPLVLVLEDLHWSDRATLDWLAYAARRRGIARLFVVGTFRPIDAMVTGHAVRTLAQDLRAHRLCNEVILDGWPETAVIAYLEQRFGQNDLATDLGAMLHQCTYGNPLFVVTAVDAMTHQGLLWPGPQGWQRIEDTKTLAALIPQSLRQLIEQELERLSPEAQAMLEAASVAGVEFSSAVVGECVDESLERVENRCEMFVRRGQFIQEVDVLTWPDGTETVNYRFCHALYQEVIYARLPDGRRSRWHQHIGRLLETGYGDQAYTIAAELAEHFVQGQDAQRAVRYLQLAGEQTLQRSAHQEAITHLKVAQELLTTLPEARQRSQLELAVCMTLGQALTAMHGYAAAEVEQAYTRARELCQQAGELSQLFSVLMSLCVYYGNRAEHQICYELAQQLLVLAQRAAEPLLLHQAHTALGGCLLWRGQLVQARIHLEQAMTYHGMPSRHELAFRIGQDLGAFCHAYMARTLWFLGYPDQALALNREALKIAQETGHPFGLARARSFVASLHLLRREPCLAREQADEVLKAAREYELAHWFAIGRLWRAASGTTQSQRMEGVDELHQALEAFRIAGVELGRSWYSTLLAEAYQQSGQTAMGLRVLAEALETIRCTEERLYEPEMLRLRGELLLTLAAHHDEAEVCFSQALAMSRHQQAKSLELRAATSLSRLWQQHGKRNEAHALLAPIYEWFTEGKDTHDLQEAKALLEELVM